ncbi:MAG: Fe-S cluster assembly protein HesB [Nocardioidaceae bacterium]|nr:Fe-S cluster assembly protein HesB [Nocardioidaceae bacterium]
MLTLTENASHVVKSITEQSTEVETAGLRISTSGAEPGEMGLEAAEGPLPGDQVVEEAGARIFLEESAATLLDDKTLDAMVDESGTVQFAVAPQG